MYFVSAFPPSFFGEASCLPHFEIFLPLKIPQWMIISRCGSSVSDLRGRHAKLHTHNYVTISLFRPDESRRVQVLIGLGYPLRGDSGTASGTESAKPGMSFKPS